MNPFKYDPLENFLFSTITFFSDKHKGLNTPDLNMRCQCTGKLMITGKTNKGVNFLCLRCFSNWIKPLNGMLYREKDIGERAKEYRKLLKDREQRKQAANKKVRKQ